MIFFSNSQKRNKLKFIFGAVWLCGWSWEQWTTDDVLSCSSTTHWARIKPKRIKSDYQNENRLLSLYLEVLLCLTSWIWFFDCLVHAMSANKVIEIHHMYYTIHHMYVYIYKHISICIHQHTNYFQLAIQKVHTAQIVVLRIERYTFVSAADNKAAHNKYIPSKYIIMICWCPTPTTQRQTQCVYLCWLLLMMMIVMITGIFRSWNFQCN